MGDGSGAHQRRITGLCISPSLSLLFSPFSPFSLLLSLRSRKKEVRRMEKIDPAIVLLVEDDPGDQKLVKVSLKKQRLANELHIVSSGEEALDFLYQRGKFDGGVPRPDLIFLDLNMPGMGGKGFLRRMKEDENLRKIPVVILTTSDSEQDIIDSYDLHASGYVKKPIDLNEFTDVMKEVGEYWFMICKLPPKEG